MTTDFLMSQLQQWSKGSLLSGEYVVPVGTPVLHQATRQVAEIDAEIRKLADFMLYVMRARSGVGLAANQVGAPLQMFVHALGGAAPEVIINPEIVRATGARTAVEGCLSLKLTGSHAAVTRPSRVLVRGILLNGGEVEIDAGGYLARVFQHEIDHLAGIEYVQRLQGGERMRIYRLLREMKIETSPMPPRPYGSALGSRA